MQADAGDFMGVEHRRKTHREVGQLEFGRGQKIDLRVLGLGHFGSVIRVLARLYRLGYLGGRLRRFPAQAQELGAPGIVGHGRRR